MTSEELGLGPLEPPDLEGVYVVYGWPGFVKIGQATNSIRDRMDTLQSGCPVDLSLLAVLSFRPDDEGLCHMRFREQHHRREWFYLEGALVQAIREARTHYAVPLKKPQFFKPGISWLETMDARVERRKYIFQQVAQGVPYAEIGRAVGLSGNRVAQIWCRASCLAKQLLRSNPIGHRVQTLRLAASMTQEQLAVTAKTTNLKISRIENNYIKPDVALANRLAAALGVAIDDLAEPWKKNRTRLRKKI
jgi:DNA-binding XRE family transcriptional regulator